MIKSIYLIVFALFSHFAILNAMENVLDQVIPANTSAIKEQKPPIEDYDLIKDRELFPPDQQVGLINFGTIVKGVFSAYHQYGTKKMVNYNFAYDKVCAKVVKDLVTDKRYLVNHLKISHANLFKLHLGSMAISYLVLTNVWNVPANYFNAMLGSMDAYSPYSNEPTFFDKYHMVYGCNTKMLYNLAFLFGCLSVYLYYNLPTYINNTLDRIIIEENVCDAKSQFDPVTVKYLCHSIDRKACKNPLISEMYPDALKLRNEYKKEEFKTQDIPKATEAGKYTLWRIINKMKMGTKVSKEEEENYKFLMAFSLFRHEIGLTRLWEEPMNLWIILRKLCGYRYIFDKDEAQMGTDIANIDKVIQILAGETNTLYFEDQISNQDLNTQKAIASLASNLKLKDELLSLTIEDTDNGASSDIEKAKLFLKVLMQEEFVLAENDTTTS